MGIKENKEKKFSKLENFFPLNLTPTYSAYQLTKYYRQKGLNLLNS